MTGITVNELADRIRRPEDDRPYLIRQLRDWTRLGLLETVGEANPGTGRHRRYPIRAIDDAVVLAALTEMGFQSVRASELRSRHRDLIHHARSAFDLHRKDPRRPVLLIVHWQYKRGRGRSTMIGIKQIEVDVVGFRKNEGVVIPDDADSVTVLNISALAKRIIEPVGE